VSVSKPLALSIFSNFLGESMKIRTVVSFSILAISLVVNLSAYAAPVTWQLLFFEDDNVVGNGQFSYDPAILSGCISGQDTITCDDFVDGEFVEHTGGSTPVQETGFYTYTELDSGYANVKNETSFLSGWWHDPTNNSLPGQLECDRGNCSLTEGEWLMINDVFVQDLILSMGGFNQVSNTSWTGSWSQVFFDTTNFNPNPSSPVPEKSGGGTFTATLAPVPIPGALVLFFSGFVGLIWKIKKPAFVH
jgi:hypothetical protein